MPAGEGAVIIRPVTQHNGKEPAIYQLRPAQNMSPASVTSHLDQWLVVEYSHTDTLTSSASVASAQKRA